MRRGTVRKLRQSAVVLCVFAASCKQKPSPPAAASASAKAPSSASALPAPSARSAERDEELDAATESADAGEFKTAELADVGPAGPASASPSGVVMTTRDDEVLVAALGAGEKGGFKSIDRQASAFSPYARGPAIAGDYAYWISKGRLVRRRISGPSPLESLAEGARDGTRVAALDKTANRPALAVYIANPSKPNGDAVAMLWSDGLGTERLSPEGAAASSASLADVGEIALASYVEGRTGMSPVHAREIRVTNAKLVLAEDVVLWVGGSAQALTEIATTSAGSEAWSFIPIERDITRFGLAEIQIGEHPKMGAPVTWRAYPNGLDPAPLAVGQACGSNLVLYARPSEAKPGAPQELHLSPLRPEGLGTSEIVARSRTFSNVSIAPIHDSALVVYVAGHRTWAARVRCGAAGGKK